MPVRKRRAQPLLVLALGLPACASIAVQEEVAEAPVKPATNAAKLQKATILDTDFYQPRARLEGCDGGALSRASEISAELAAGLKEAKAYSDNAKGVGLIVLRDGEIVHESYNTNADAQTHTVSASMMKSVLGLMTGIAIDKGMIGSVDDRSARRRYRPPVTDHVERAGAVRLHEIAVIAGYRCRGTGNTDRDRAGQHICL